MISNSSNIQTVRCGIEAVKLPARSPNLNAYAERFVRTIKEDCLDRMVFFGEDMLRRTIREFVTHYHEERNHQGLDNQLLIKKPTIVDWRGPVDVQRRRPAESDFDVQRSCERSS